MTHAPVSPLPIEIIQLPHAQDLPLPAYETAGAAGMDLRAAIDHKEPVSIEPGARALIATGLSIAIPQGFEAQIRPRSGLALKHGITCLNTPGTIDSDYRGEVKVILINLGDGPFEVVRGDRIAQMVVSPVIQAVWQQVQVIDQTGRGGGGFGSSGRR